MFFEKYRSVIGEEVTEAILSFFDQGVLCPYINCTSVALIPKVHNPTLVKLFQPISCCDVLQDYLKDTDGKNAWSYRSTSG